MLKFIGGLVVGVFIGVLTVHEFPQVSVWFGFGG
jgi:F0F1-type ATP synthase assembly protein I